MGLWFPAGLQAQDLLEDKGTENIENTQRMLGGSESGFESGAKPEGLDSPQAQWAFRLYTVLVKIIDNWGSMAANQSIEFAFSQPIDAKSRVKLNNQDMDRSLTFLNGVTRFKDSSEGTVFLTTIFRMVNGVSLDGFSRSGAKEYTRGEASSFSNEEAGTVSRKDFITVLREHSDLAR